MGKRKRVRQTQRIRECDKMRGREAQRERYFLYSERGRKTEKIIF